MLKSYVVLDLETTGLNPKLDKIIEIGAVKIRDGIEAERFETYVNPGRSLPKRISELTGIREEDLTQAPYVEEVLPQLLLFLGDEVLVGHNILVDYSFLKRAMVNAGFSFDREGVDTLKLARIYRMDLPSHRLAAMCEAYGIAIHNHRALWDAIATDALYRRLCEDFETADSALQFAPYKLTYQVKKENPATPAQLERLARIVAERNIVLDVELKKLSKNEASRLLDRIRSGDYAGA